MSSPGSTVNVASNDANSNLSYLSADATFELQAAMLDEPGQAVVSWVAVLAGPDVGDPREWPVELDADARGVAARAQRLYALPDTSAGEFEVRADLARPSPKRWHQP